MDFDIPLPEELEWLESHTNFTEDDDDFDFETLPPEQQNDAASHSESTGHKRLRSESPDALVDLTVSGEKRSKVGDDVAEDEEEWLRYSPPREEDVVEEVREKEKIVSRFASEIDGEFVPVTAPGGGDRVYAKFCRAERGEKLDVRSKFNGLLAESSDVLLRRLEQKAFSKALQASSESQGDVEPLEIQEVHEKLWVDKYAPCSFTELLSDEQTNREVLLWLKQWDSVVFGSEIRSTSEEVFSALRRHSSISQHKASDSTFSWKNRGRWTAGNFRNVNNVNNKNSNSRGVQEMWNKKSRHTGPPEQKILLLCGPPGLGKTTLAHVAARHCGYRVVEVNASDDRSSSTIEAKILDVVQMDSVMADSRPKCLVVDEIDGALGDGRGAVEVILKMVAGEKKVGATKENAGKGEQSKRASSKKGHKAATLLRPVICICNDLYAPALRPLRQVAKVHIFVQPTVSRVVSRLKHICSKEGMKTSSISLTSLAEYTECDIRSCLNTLQFLNKKKETLNVADVGSQVVGRKDISKGVFDIWKEIFHKKKSKPDRKSYGNCSMPSEMEFLHSLVSNRGDYDVIFDGIHENVLHLQYHDPLMQKTVKCINSLGISDLMQQHIMRTQQMPLYAYQSYSAITVHRIVAQVQKPNIEWPKSHQRYRTTLMEKMYSLRSWQTKMPSYISRHLSTKSFVEDTLSSFLHILSPANLKPVALHLLSEKEKHDFLQLVNTMVSYAITYKNIKVSPSSKQEVEATLDSLSLSFDPPICDFVSFNGYNSGHYVLPLPMKQVLVHEVEKLKILQLSKTVHLMDGCHKENPQPTNEKKSEIQSAKIDQLAAFASGSENGQKTVNPIQSNSNGTKISKALDSTVGGSASVSLNVKGNVKKPSRGSTNFFDRFRKAKSKDSQNESNGLQKETLERDSRPLLFKFNEGFTNAIKKPVRMREFV